MCKWFKHDVLAHRDKKLRALRAKHGHNGTGIYFHLLEVMGYDDDGYLPYDLNALSIELGLIKRKDREVLAEVISDFGLFEFTEDNGTRYFYSPRFVEQLEGISSARNEMISDEDTPNFGSESEIESEIKPKRKYTLSDKARNQRRANSEAIRNQVRNQSEIESEMSPKTGGTIGGEKEDIRIKSKDNIDSVGAKPQKRFVPPTPDEVREYCSSKGYPDESERFVDFYTSKGWRVGNSPMKDWQAALRNWMRKDNRQPNTSQSPRGERLIRGDSQMDKVRDARW